MKRKKIAVIATVFNRCETTLSGLSRLYKIIENESNFLFEVFVTNDGCTDDTELRIKENFPLVHIIQGNGSLFWGGGMRLAWQSAIDYDDFDYYLWFNDDVLIYPNAISNLIEVEKEAGRDCIVCGAFCSSLGKFTYGGLDEFHNKVVPNGKIQKIHYMNGNLVLVPVAVVKKIGILDPAFIHISGDFDYGLTAYDFGIPVFSSTQFVGEAERNPKGDSRGRKLGVGLIRRFKMLFQSPFIDNPQKVFYFNRKHHRTLLFCIYFFIRMIVLTMIPDGIYLKIKRNNG